VYQDLSDRIVDLLRDGALDSPFGAIIAWGLETIDRLGTDLRRYDLAKDDARYPDERLFHRVLLTNAYELIGASTGWSELSAGARAALDSLIVPGMPRLAVHGGWVEDKVSISKIVTDFKDNFDTPIPDLHLTTFEISALYEATFVERLSELVRTNTRRLEAEGTLLTADEDAVVRAQLEALPRPRRYKPKEFVWLVAQADRDRLPMAEPLKRNQQLRDFLSTTAMTRGLARTTGQFFPSIPCRIRPSPGCCQTSGPWLTR
jgi:hypothetical protein